MDGFTVGGGTFVALLVVSLTALGAGAAELDYRRRRELAVREPIEGVIDDERTLDVIMGRELARARRHDRPLAVVSIWLGEVPAAEVALPLVDSLRATDVVGRVAPRRLVAALPETSGPAATALVRRFRATLDVELAAGLRIGVASFPQDDVTWIGLQATAAEREGADDDGDDGPGAHPPAQPPGARRVRPPAGRSRSRLLRRAVDLAFVVLTAPFVVPLVAVLALAVRLETRGPIFVGHRRVGLAGKPFVLLKMRTMVENADELKDSVAHLNVLPWPDFKIPNDPRVTRVGRFLRRTSLDELPQLWNVVRGELTLVGPRPCSVGVDKYELWQTERLEAVPGLFGRWQAYGRGSAAFADRCRMDIAQVRNRSIVAQARLALATVNGVVRGRGAG